MIRMTVYEMMAKRGFQTRRELAQATGMHPSNIGKMVSGDSKAIRLDSLDALCKVLKCAPGDLLEYVEE